MERLRSLAGWLALAVAAALGVVAVARGAVNALTMWTVIAGAAGGILLLARRARATDTLAAVLLFLAAAPAMIGGLGLLLLPSVMLAWGVAIAPRHPVA